MTDGDIRRIVLLGKTGSGKSSLGNTVLGGGESFRVASGVLSGTEKCQRADEDLRTTLQIIDTPGLFDTHEPAEKIYRGVGKRVAVASPGPYIIIIALRCDRRFTDEEFLAYKKLKELFSDDMKYFLVIVSNGMDALDATIRLSMPYIPFGSNRRKPECMEKKETGRLRTEVHIRGTSIADLFFIRTVTGPPKAEEELNTQKAILAAKLDRNKTKIYLRTLHMDRPTNRSEQEITNNNNNNNITKETNVGEKTNRPAATQKDTKTSSYQGKTDVGGMTTAKRQNRKTNHWAREVQKDTGKAPSASRGRGSFLWAFVFVAATLMRGCIASDVVECSTKVAKVGENITAEIRCSYGINFEGITQDIIIQKVVQKVDPSSNVRNYHNLLLHCYWEFRSDGRKCKTKKSGAETLVKAGLVGVKLSGLKPDDEGEYECVILSPTPYPNRPCNLTLDDALNSLLGNNEAENSQSDEQQEMLVLSVVVPCVVVGFLFLVTVSIFIALRRRGYLCEKSPEDKGYTQDTGKAAAKKSAQVEAKTLIR